MRAKFSTFLRVEKCLPGLLNMKPYKKFSSKRFLPTSIGLDSKFSLLKFASLKG